MSDNVNIFNYWDQINWSGDSLIPASGNNTFIGYNFVRGLINSQSEVAVDLLNLVGEMGQVAIDNMDRGLDLDSIEELFQEFKSPTFQIDSYDYTFPTFNQLADIPDIDTTVTLPAEFLTDFTLREVKPVTRDAPVVDHEVEDQEFALPDAFTDQVPDIDTSGLDFTVPEYAQPERPTLIERGVDDLPEKPNIEEILSTINRPLTLDPHFQGTIPTDAAQKYKDEFARFYNLATTGVDEKLTEFVNKFFPDQTIQRNLLDTYLKDFVEGRRTLFTDRVEELLYTRQQNRNELQYFRERDEALRTAQETSNPIMPARLQAQLLRVGESAAARNTESAISITEQRLQVEIENMRFSLQMIFNLRELLHTTRDREFGRWLQTMELSLQDARQFSEVLYQAADRFLQLYAQDIDKARLEIADLERIRENARLQLELYVTELRGEELIQAINNGRISIYGIDAQTYATLYSAAETRIRGLLAQVELRKVPLDTFLAKVQAYNGYVNGVDAYNNAVKALIEGDVAQIQGQVAAVQGWESEKRAEIADRQAAIAEIEARATVNQALSQYVEAQANLKRLKGELYKLNAENDQLILRANIDAALAEQQGYLNEFNIGTEIELRKKEVELQYAQTFKQVALQSQELLLNRNRAQGDVISGILGNYVGVAQSLFNGLNTVLSASDLIPITDGDILEP